MKPIELAKALVQSVQDSEESKAYRAAKTRVDEHAAAKVMLDDFRAKQRTLYEKHLRGEEITEADQNELQKLMEIVSLNTYIREFLATEYALGQLLMDIQKVVDEGIGMSLNQDNVEKEMEV